jgi:GTP pyrophosphokinase
VRTARARSKIRHHLKTLALTDSESLGEKMLAQALRAEGVEKIPDDKGQHKTIWEKLLRFSGNRNRAELFGDIGMGKRIASIVAKRLRALLTDSGETLDTVLLTRERYAMNETEAQGGILLDGSENTSVSYAHCCRPVPGDAIVGYLGRGEGLIVHTDDCSVAKKLKHKDSERFINVEWSDEPVRAFETAIRVTVINGKGVLARVAAALATAEIDITHITMDDEVVADATTLGFLIAVRDRNQLETALQNLRKTASVLKVQRTGSGGGSSQLLA